MFEYIYVSEESSDCTRNYELKFDGLYTVQEFINHILTKRTKDWGTITVTLESGEFGRQNAPAGCLEYFRGEVKNDKLSDKLKAFKIISAKGYGGWSSNSYILCVADKPQKVYLDLNMYALPASCKVCTLGRCYNDQVQCAVANMTVPDSYESYLKGRPWWCPLKERNGSDE